MSDFDGQLEPQDHIAGTKTSKCPMSFRAEIHKNLSLNSKIQTTFQDDASLLNEVPEWFKNSLGCVQGRREFALGRYLYGCVRNPEHVRKQYQLFYKGLLAFQKVGCLFVFNDPSYKKESPKSFERILTEMGKTIAAGLGVEPPKLEGTGQSLSLTVEARCPVTNAKVIYDDFDVVAFLPHAGDTENAFYDPSTESPFACANLTSDIFGFSMFIRDQSLSKEGREVWEINDINRISTLLDRSAHLWQKLSVKSISNFAARTDTRVRCPMRISKDESVFYAPHEEAAFGERSKELHEHQMPKLYTPRILQTFINYFKYGVHPEMRSLFCRGERIEKRDSRAFI